MNITCKACGNSVPIQHYSHAQGKCHDCCTEQRPITMDCSKCRDTATVLYFCSSCKQFACAKCTNKEERICNTCASVLNED